MWPDESPAGPALLWAARQPWAPKDWSLVPAWQAWRREVEADRRDVLTDDHLSEAAYAEAHACLSAAFGRTDRAAVELRVAHDLVQEGIAEHERLRPAS